MKFKSLLQVIRNRINPENYSIKRFVEFASRNIKPGQRILDAGAGNCPYKKYFLHTKYESTDIGKEYSDSTNTNHNFLCSLDKIPVAKNSYDAIINTQVLEHVEDPQKVINEFYRILKNNGKLFLTCPLGGRVHGEPHNYFTFTPYGLELVFKKAGFKVIFIKPRGGIYSVLSITLRELPKYILDQHRFKKANKNFIGSLINYILYLISLPFCGIIFPLIFYYLDKLDKKRTYTLGYACYCIKEPR
jgi:SAM-dependent methyltransferase